MNVYEEAHNLARAIKESEEYKQFMENKNKLEENPSVKAMIEDFEKKSMELQMKQIAGEDINDEIMQKAMELNQIVMGDPIAAEYMQNQMRFGIMMQDVYKILEEVTK